MRVAIFSNTYLPTISGVVRSISSFKAALEELGHEVHVFTQGARSYQDSEKNIHRYVSFNPGLPNDLPVTIPFSPTMNRLITDLKPDVIHAQHPFLLGNEALRKARQLGVPLIYTLHAQYWQYQVYLPVRSLQHLYGNFIVTQVKRYLHRCDHIIAPSESMRKLIVERFQVNKPVTVLPTGVDLTSYDRGSRDLMRKKLGWGRDFVIITTGRLAPEKSWPDLIDAAAEVIQGVPKVRMVFLGEGPERGSLEQRAKDLGIRDNVEFVGMVPYEEVARYLVAADLFAFTSQTETQGLATLEAMAAGLPVVAYDAIGTRDVVVNGKNGTLAPANSKALALAISNLMQDPGHMDQLRRGALKAAQELDIRRLAKKLVTLYETSIAQISRP